MVTERSLINYGYNVIPEFSGEEAIDTINANSDIELILMDIDLGDGMNGIETAKSILSSHNIPIVFLSNHTDKENVAITETVTSYGYIVKNSGITVLDASIKMALKLYESKEKTEHLSDQYSKIFDLTNDMVEVLELIYNEKGEAIDWYIRQINPSFCKFLGKTEEELINQKVTSVIGEIEETWFSAFSQVDKTGETIKFENYGIEFDKNYKVAAWKLPGNLIGVSFHVIDDSKIN